MKVTTAQLEEFAALIKAEVGIVYSDSNFFQLENRLSNFSSTHSLKSVDELLNELRGKQDSLLRRAFFDLATNNETSFFRDDSLFEGIERVFFPSWWAIFKSTAPLDIWSAASSSGQEIYSMSMMVNQFRATHPQLTYRLYASDYSSKMVSRVQEGTYSQIEVQRGLPTVKLILNFDKVGEQTWRVKPHLKTHLDVFHANLLEPLKKDLKADLVLLRNVLIYHTPENKKEIIKRISAHLKPGGFLILGSAETLFGISTDFDQVQWGSAIVYQLKGAK